VALEQAQRVDAATGGVAAEAVVALAELDGDGVLAHAGVRQTGSSTEPRASVDGDDVAVVEAQPVGGAG
jgi:hypothetical protein